MKVPKRYQADARDSALNSLSHSVAIALPTGTGKTFIAWLIIQKLLEDPTNRILFLVNAEILMRQAGKEFGTTNFHGDGQRANWYEALTIGIIQTVHKENLHITKKITHVFLDEAHHAISDMYKEILDDKEHFKKIISLSATMFRADGKGLGEVVDEIVYERDIHWAISQGHLTSYQILRPTNVGQLPFSHRIYQVLDPKTKEEKSIRKIKSYDHPKRNEIVAEMVHDAMEKHDRKAGIIFCNTLENCKNLADILGDGWDWCGGNRKNTIDDFKAGKLKGIVSCQLLLEGFDYPPADFLLVNGKIKSDSTGKIRWIQLLGRVLRLFPGKENAIIIDLCEHPLKDPQYSGNLEATGEDEPDLEEQELINISVLLEENLDLCVLRGYDFTAALVKVNEEYKHFKKIFGTCLEIREIEEDVYDIMHTPYRFRKRHNGNFLLYTGTNEKEFSNFSVMERAILKKHEYANYDNKQMRGNITQKQRKILSRNGYKDEDLDKMAKSEASSLIERIFSIQGGIPATAKQKYFLDARGIEHNGNLTKREAGKLIAQCQKKEPYMPEPLEYPVDPYDGRGCTCFQGGAPCSYCTSRAYCSRCNEIFYDPDGKFKMCEQCTEKLVEKRARANRD